ncbi:hypothetical protein EI42_04975 [Thermosporothrix hazakensis]|jgi:hypothetical protein|uniref:Uncharacterized protein n=2 Tax=Thermosporothrix TaxID=768650 RepID=A0A326U0A7_THEHA|nr:hypothetical protein EI42_04975 [Thermosporothrix hazakensis]
MRRTLSIVLPILQQEGSKRSMSSSRITVGKLLAFLIPLSCCVSAVAWAIAIGRFLLERERSKVEVARLQSLTSAPADAERPE